MIIDWEAELRRQEQQEREYKEYREQLDKKIEKAKMLLKKCGFQIDIVGCGCCESPEITMIYKGEKILEMWSESFYMTKEDKT